MNTEEKSDCCKADLSWEVWTCVKNPHGIIPEPNDHGNEIDGTITCDDDYCQPTDLQLEGTPTDEFIRTHEAHSRCSKCGFLTGD